MSTIYLVFVLGIFAVPSLGQSSRQFQWAFQDTALSTTLPTCVPFPIVVKSFDPTTNATNGVPPYYMISFAVGSTPVTTFIGEDENNLSWTVTQPAGSQLLLSVVDSTGGAGGIPPQLIQIVPGQTTECVTTPLPSTPAFTVSANVSGTLETCQPWGITVKGGSPPYTITFAETNSPVVTNVSMPFGADRFTFPNRADPGGQLIAAISDLEGRWATGTPIVQPVGSSNTSCIGLVSTSGNSTVIDAQDAALNASLDAAKRRKSLITGLSITLVFVLLIGLGGLGYLQWKKRQQQERESSEEQRARQFTQTPETSIGAGWASENGITISSVGAVENRDTEKRRAGRNNNQMADVEAPPYTEVASSAAAWSTSTAGPSSQFPPLPPIPNDNRPEGSRRLKLAKLETSSLPISRPKVRPEKKPTENTASGPVSNTGAAPLSIPPKSTLPASATTTPTVSNSIDAASARPKGAGAGFATFPRKSIRNTPLRIVQMSESETNSSPDTTTTPVNPFMQVGEDEADNAQEKRANEPPPRYQSLDKKTQGPK